jgi:hypothetical protein
MFSIRFSEKLLEHWAGENKTDFSKMKQIGDDARKRGYLTKPEFLKICESKSSRTKSRCAKNSEEFIREVTQVSFKTADEQLRIQILTLLEGVAWPTASYLLHFCCRDPYDFRIGNAYPVLDFRALWSLNAEVPKAYDFPFWWAYTEYCRTLAVRNGISMRALDSALWQYSLADSQV